MPEPSTIAPVTVETTGMSPAFGVTGASSASTRSRTLSTWAECPAAIAPFTRRARAPSASASARNSSTAAVSPDTTTDSGPLTAATLSRSPQRSSRAATHSCGRATDAIAPSPDSSSCMVLLRRQMIRAASGSDSAPATQAAATSPWECPTTAAGNTPAACQVRASATITANSSGWTTSSRCGEGAPGRSYSTSRTDQSTNSPSAASHSASDRANAGEESRSSTAMPGHCEPWPGKTSTGPAPGAAVPVTRWGCASPPARAVSAASASSRSPATTAARCSSSVTRVVANSRPSVWISSAEWSARKSRSRRA